MAMRVNSPRSSHSVALAPESHRLTRSRITWRLAALVFPVALAVACTSWRASHESPALTPEELLSGVTLGVADGSVASVVDEREVLAVSAEMQAFVDAHVDRNGAASLKLHQLVNAIIGANTFGVVYDDITRTAAETFRLRRGNCLSFANMFVAMARDVGLAVQFQEVDVPPDWTLENDTFVLNRHVNVRVDLGPDGVKVVDFNIADFKSSYEIRAISDARALAHYYNNIGVARMQAGDTGAALLCFRIAAAENDRGFSPAWTNLGTLYLRNRHPAQAMAAFLQALEVNPGDLVAMSNLARLYERLGDRDRAETYRKKVVYHRKLNPYYRFELARRAYLNRQYGVAIGHLKYAIRKRPKEDEFYFLLGATYVKKGNLKAGRRYLAKAEEVAATDALKRRYSSKIDTLLGQGAGKSR